jgi:hypothetical protein
MSTNEQQETDVGINTNKTSNSSNYVIPKEGSTVEVDIGYAPWLLQKTGLTTVNDLTMLTKLELANCGLTSLPEILPIIVPNLSILFCPKNNFSEMPAMIGNCKKLQMVSFKDCTTLTSIHPDALQSHLRWLILTGCTIEVIPETISRCGPSLQKLMLSGNKIRSLPTSISMLQNLELVRLACNQLDTSPIQLLQLPNLKWVALSRNPFLMDQTRMDRSIQHSLPILDDPVLEENDAYTNNSSGSTTKILGRGAGGVTRQVTYDGREVAVKTFVGELTSDGSPQDEKAVSVAAAAAMMITAPLDNSINKNIGRNDRHDEPAALIRLLGETKKDGALVMELLKGYTALAGPPSMDSCSRDVYDDDHREALLSESFCWKIAMAMLNVLCKIHKAGICHGDFYGHNILINPTTESVKLSDFGAAYFYDTSNELYGALIPQIELRAYSVLIEELLTLHNNRKDDCAGDGIKKATQTPPPDRLKQLLTACHEQGSTFQTLVAQFLSNITEEE